MMNGARAQLECASPPLAPCPRLEPSDRLLFTLGRAQKPKCQMICGSLAVRAREGVE